MTGTAQALHEQHHCRHARPRHLNCVGAGPLGHLVPCTFTSRMLHPTDRSGANPTTAARIDKSSAITLDMRHIDVGHLQAMPERGKQASEPPRRTMAPGVAWRTIYQSAPQLFDSRLIDLCDEAIREVNDGVSHRMPSGPGHDAIEMAWAGVPTVTPVRRKACAASVTQKKKTQRSSTLNSPCARLTCWHRK